MAASAPSIDVERLRFPGEWRRYQELALEALRTTAGKAAVERTSWRLRVRARRCSAWRSFADSASGRSCSSRTRPFRRSGSGRLRHSALKPGLPRPEAGAGVACLTYQALARLDDPAVALGDLAERRWALDRAKSTGKRARWSSVRRAPGQERLRPAASARSRESPPRSSARSLARSTAISSSGICSATVPGRAWTSFGEIESGRWFSTSAITWPRSGATSSAPRSRSSATCISSGSPRAPRRVTKDEAELYGSLLGPVDSPCRRRPWCGTFLAPYQELAWLTPCSRRSEHGWQSTTPRFQELITTLHDDGGEAMSLPSWVIVRMRDRGRQPTRARPSLGLVPARAPDLARAGRALPGARLGSSLRPDATRRGLPRATQSRRLARPARGLRNSLPRRRSRPAAAARYEAIAAALRSLGFHADPSGHSARGLGGRPAADELRGEDDRVDGGRRLRVRQSRRTVARARPRRRRARGSAARRVACEHPSAGGRDRSRGCTCACCRRSNGRSAAAPCLRARLALRGARRRGTAPGAAS